MSVKIKIYTLSNPITGEIRYVGKTVDIVKRLRAHNNESRKNKKCNWVKSLRIQGLRPKLEVLEEVSECDWEEAERYWISSFKLLGFNLTNYTVGGDNGKRLHTETPIETRIKMSNSAKNVSLETREKRRINQLGKKLSEETKLKLSKFFKGRKMPAHSVAIIMAKKRTPEARAKQSEKIKAVWAARKIAKNSAFYN